MVITVVKVGVVVFRVVTPFTLVGDIHVSKEQRVCLFWRWQTLTTVRDVVTRRLLALYTNGIWR
jgi:hypothetical protein